MSLLNSLRSPADLQRMTPTQLDELAGEIRELLVNSVSKTGGHLGPNLGVVELSIALHRVFRSPQDTLIFDTGHQAYVHKLLTGRQDFSRLRQRGGVSGYPSRAESEHDVVENSHASTSLSWGYGVELAHELLGSHARSTVAVIGDGAMTGGMAWEALNNIAENEEKTRGLVIVLNDNGRSYAPTIGGFAHHLDALRTSPKYEEVLELGRKALKKAGAPGRAAYDTLHAMKAGARDALRGPDNVFDSFGIKYLGPVDGHDITAMEFALTRARDFDGPAVVHVMTDKGRGYTPAECDVADHFHAVGVIHPETGLPVAPSRFGWTAVFADEMLEIARKRSDIVGITAAMQMPVGLGPMSEEFPERVIDVGIAEQHAATAAAGMAFGGLHPVVALYATFLNRAFDQVLMDVALHRAGVTFVLDRAGLTGDDGASHNGMWDMALLRSVPGLRLAAPRDEDTLRQALREAVDVHDAPTVVRYPKGAIPEPVPAISTRRGYDVLAQHGAPSEVLLVAVGATAHTALEVAGSLHTEGVGVTVVDPRWVLPVADQLRDFAAQHRLVVTIEDGLADNGVGDALRSALARAEADVPVRTHGIPTRFLDHATRAQLLDSLHLIARDVTRQTLATYARLADRDGARLGEGTSSGMGTEPSSTAFNA